MLRTCVRIFLTSLCVYLLSITAFGQPRYRMRLLGGALGIFSIVPLAINFRGRWSEQCGTALLPFRWNPVEGVKEPHRNTRDDVDAERPGSRPRAGGRRAVGTSE